MMVGMSRVRKEQKKEQRKKSDDLMTEVEVWGKARERGKYLKRCECWNYYLCWSLPIE